MTVTDSSSNKASGTFHLTINPPPLNITGPSSPLPTATALVTYTPVTFTASGGTGGYVWTESGLAASTGLSLSSAGALSGIPTSGSQGSYTLTVTVTDSSSNQAQGTFHLTINAAQLTITGPSSLPTATVLAAYSPVTFTASGGTGGYTWQCTGLPAGLSVSPAGVLSGTPASGTRYRTP